MIQGGRGRRENELSSVWAIVFNGNWWLKWVRCQNDAERFHLNGQLRDCLTFNNSLELRIDEFLIDLLKLRIYSSVMGIGKGIGDERVRVLKRESPCDVVIAISLM